MRRFLSLLFFCTFSSIAFAQSASIATSSIKGKVLDGKKQPIPYATLTLLTESQQVAGGALTDDQGIFQITEVPMGKYRIRINVLGFADKFLENISVVSSASPLMVEDIILGTNTTTTLDEVAVVAERRQVDLSIDKKTFNVEKNISSSGGSAADVLQNVPSLAVTTEGELSLRGKSNVTLLIDGKPATLLGSDNASALQALPAGSIESVEVITNPSAKYDAQGMSGIVNIITKKEKKPGYNGSITAGIGTRDKYNAGISLNRKSEKWNVFYNANARLNRSLNNETLERKNLSDGYEIYSIENGIRKRDAFTNTLGAEYFFSKTSSLSLTQNINFMRFGGSSSTTLNNGIPSDSSQYRSSDRTINIRSYSTSLAHTYKFKNLRSSLNSSATYGFNNVGYEQDLNTWYYNYKYGPEYGVVNISTRAGGKNSNTTLQSDFTTQAAKSSAKYEAGLKYQDWTFQTGNTPIITTPDGSSSIDSSLITRYTYTLDVIAGYVNHSNKLGRWSYQTGLRLEEALYNGEVQLVGGGKFRNEFLNLFPSAYLAYQITPDSQSFPLQQVYLNYTRRVERPGFRDLMPYIDISNPADIRRGNPDLKPEFINNFELSYFSSLAKGHTIMLSAYTQYSTNLIERYRTFNNDGTSITQPQNLGSGITYGLEMITRLQLSKAWDATLNGNLFRNQVNGTNIDPSLSRAGWGWFAKLNTNLKFPAQFSLQVLGNYESAKINAQSTTQPLYWMDLALKKSFWKGKASMIVNVSDIANTRKRTLVYDLNGYQQTNFYNPETRIGNLTLSYNFGRSVVKPQDKKNSRSNTPATNQVKQPSEDVKPRDFIKEEKNGDNGGM